MSRILGPDGREFALSRTSGNGDGHGTDAEAMLKAYVTFTQAVAGLSVPAISRSYDPFHNHPWVFAAAMAIATNSSQAPLLIYREEDDAQDKRRQRFKDMKMWEGVFPTGTRRTAFLRYCQGMKGYRQQGMRCKGLDEFPEHPLSALLLKPNPIMDGGQFLFLTDLWMALRNEVFWLFLDDSGSPVSWTSGKYTQVWPVSPDLFKEMIVGGRTFEGWWMTVPRGIGSSFEGTQIPIAYDEVVQFKVPDPENPLRGASPLNPIAADVYHDNLSIKYNTSIIQGGGDPGGVLIHEGKDNPFKDKAEEDEWRKSWMQRHGSSDKSRQIALLYGGWKYVPISLRPKEMEWLEGRKWNRDEILAVMNVPKAVVFVTDDLNHATAYAQKKLLWESNIIPRLMNRERTLEATLLYDQPDTIVGMHDTTNIEALRSGIDEKVKTMMSLCGDEIHMDPKNASEVVGLKLPPFFGDDLAFTTPGLITVDDVISGAKPPVAGAPVLPGKDKPPTSPVMPDQAQPVGTNLQLTGDGRLVIIRSGIELPTTVTTPTTVITHQVKKAASTWGAIIRDIQAPAESRMKVAWRLFVEEEQRLQLRAFDQSIKGKSMLFEKATDPSGALLDLLGVKGRLRASFRKEYARELKSVFQYTVRELGVATFELDDPRIVAAFDKREDLLLNNVPKTIQTRLRESIRKGLERGESMAELRDRVGRAFNVMGSAAKALQIARTESAGFMNDAREAMFQAQQFEKREWLTARDEHVRRDHRRFGRSGKKKAGFNYMTLVNKAGILEYPNDPRGPADEVINCRCVHVPA